MYFKDAATLIGWGSTVKDGSSSSELKSAIVTIYDYR
jgi:hypothetical protein